MARAERQVQGSLARALKLDAYRAVTTAATSNETQYLHNVLIMLQSVGSTLPVDTRLSDVKLRCYLQLISDISIW
jgi:hypothetical protein